ncbi:hypothetical protein DRJ22_01395 [Candidatus Woesearchaeota archaeon]|nr:MAG: hypothetical protein B6U93_00745 [Candidatus Woesearchaeota archaeon ex4484_78]RLE46656.1 MAG: hypothetical protein DRJ22_01395 [Candidatus Woesearchaeota archaeon]
MREETKLKLMLYFTIGYTTFFTINALIKKNYEFLYYTSLMILLIYLIMLFQQKIYLPTILIGGLTLLGALHMLGGNVYRGKTRLYDLWLIKNILRYDNFVHLIGMITITFIIYNVFFSFFNQKIKQNKFLFFLILILISLGVGSLNEIIEFGAVLFFNAAKGVGDYYNNAWDLVFNLIGATIAS